MIDQALIEHAERTAAECELYANRLQKKMHAVERRQKLMRFLSIFAGATAVVVSFIPPFSTTVPAGWIKGISGLAAALLIADGIWPSVFSDSVERYRDYAF